MAKQSQTPALLDEEGNLRSTQEEIEEKTGTKVRFFD